MKLVLVSKFLMLWEALTQCPEEQKQEIGNETGGRQEELT